MDRVGGPHSPSDSVALKKTNETSRDKEALDDAVYDPMTHNKTELGERKKWESQRETPSISAKTHYNAEEPCDGPLSKEKRAGEHPEKMNLPPCPSRIPFCACFTISSRILQNISRALQKKRIEVPCVCTTQRNTSYWLKIHNH